MQLTRVSVDLAKQVFSGTRRRSRRAAGLVPAAEA